MKTPESTPASDHQLMQDQAELIVELRKQLRTAREALKSRIEFLEQVEQAEDRSNLDGDSAGAVLQQLNDEATKEIDLFTADLAAKLTAAEATVAELTN